MEILGQIIRFSMDLMGIHFEIWGHSLTLWHVFIFVLVADVMAWVIWEVILGE